MNSFLTQMGILADQSKVTIEIKHNKILSLLTWINRILQE